MSIQKPIFGTMWLALSSVIFLLTAARCGITAEEETYRIYEKTDQTAKLEIDADLITGKLAAAETNRGLPVSNWIYKRLGDKYVIMRIVYEGPLPPNEMKGHDIYSGKLCKACCGLKWINTYNGRQVFWESEINGRGEVKSTKCAACDGKGWLWADATKPEPGAKIATPEKPPSESVDSKSAPKTAKEDKTTASSEIKVVRMNDGSEFTAVATTTEKEKMIFTLPDGSKKTVAEKDIFWVRKKPANSR